MSTIDDPSQQRDAIAKETATARSEQAKESATERSAELDAQIAKLTFDVHALKGGLSANTLLTREVVETLTEFRKNMGRIDFDRLADMVEGYDSIRGGVKVLGWLERPAKWLAAMLGLAAAVWALWHQRN